MSCLCQNVQRMGNPHSLLTLRGLILKLFLDLVFLSENQIIWQMESELKFKSVWTGFLVDSIGRSGSRVLLCRERWKVGIQSYSGGHIDALVTQPDEVGWRFMGFYGHPCPELGHNSWELLRRLRGLSSVPWVCSGDFNGAISMEEKKEGMDKPWQIVH